MCIIRSVSSDETIIRLTIQFVKKEDWSNSYDHSKRIVAIPGESNVAKGQRARIDVAIETTGPRSILRGETVGTREDGSCLILLDPEEEPKLAYLQGYVRGGLLDLRKMRRLPVSLTVNYGQKTPDRQGRTRDINEQGMFIIDESPWAEKTSLTIQLFFPSEPDPIDVTGHVGHTVILEDEDLPGMGILFDKKFHEQLKPIVDHLEKQFLSGTLPEEALL